MSDHERIVKLIWDAINDEEWGSIQDVRDLADAILCVVPASTEEGR